MTPFCRRSQFCVCATQDERTRMDAIEQTEWWVMGGVRTGVLLAMTDGS
jgi:hypothetical protein